MEKNERTPPTFVSCLAIVLACVLAFVFGTTSPLAQKGDGCPVSVTTDPLTGSTLIEAGNTKIGLILKEKEVKE